MSYGDAVQRSDLSGNALLPVGMQSGWTLMRQVPLYVGRSLDYPRTPRSHPGFPRIWTKPRVSVPVASCNSIACSDHLDRSGVSFKFGEATSLPARRWQY